MSAMRFLLLCLVAQFLAAPASRAASNSVVNLSHYDAMTVDFERMKREGVVAVIHEATYPPGTGDAYYAGRQAAARRAGLLWGAYHFANSSDPVRQADTFLNFVQRNASGAPDSGVLLVLDYESNTHYPGGTMNPRQAAAFAERVHQRTGGYPGFYSNENRLRATSRELEGDARSRETLGQCWLWAANYHYRPASLRPWGDWTLWQYTGDGVCDLPRSSYPISVANVRNAERNIFNGGEVSLKRFWLERAWRP